MNQVSCSHRAILQKLMKKSSLRPPQSEIPRKQAGQNEKQRVMGIKQSVVQELNETLLTMNNIIESLDQEENKKLFENWAGEDGLIEFIGTWIREDNNSWSKVMEIEEKKNQKKIQKYLYLDKQNEVMNYENKNNQNVKKQMKEEDDEQDQGQGYQKKKQINQFESENLAKEGAQDNDNLSKNMKRIQKRGPYKLYSEDLKKKIVQLYRERFLSISKISKQYDVPIKNIKRWAQNGIQRKKGAGRKKMDPEMQEKVYRKIIDNYFPGDILYEETIKKWALQLCKVKEFKASRGWINKFIQKHQLGKKYMIN